MDNEQIEQYIAEHQMDGYMGESAMGQSDVRALIAQIVPEGSVVVSRADLSGLLHYLPNSSRSNLEELELRARIMAALTSKPPKQPAEDEAWIDEKGWRRDSIKDPTAIFIKADDVREYLKTRGKE